MMNVYCLTIYDTELSYENYKESFLIGFFSSYKKAKSAAEYYLKNICGFKDYLCEYEIRKKNFIGEDENIKEIFIVNG